MSNRTNPNRHGLTIGTHTAPRVASPKARAAASILAQTLRPVRTGLSFERRWWPAETWPPAPRGRPVGNVGRSLNVGKPSRQTARDDRPSDKRLGQYYTHPDIAARLYAIFCEQFDPSSFLIIEPSAGTGSFHKLLPPGSLAFDIEPMGLGIEKADFLSIDIRSDWSVAAIGNPPFGRNSNLARKFFNHAAAQSQVIALILPRTFRKASVQNRLDVAFHLVREVDIPADSFLFRSKPYNVPAVFQIWVRRDDPRDLCPVERTHPDFVFTTADRADFAIQRVGARAGRIHHELSAPPSYNHFIRGDVEAVMAKLDLAGVARNVAGNPSVSKAEIVALYRRYTGR